MKFYEVIHQVVALLQREGRVSYRALKREFDLDDEYIEDLKAELIDAKEWAVDKDSKVLIWTGDSAPATTEAPIITPPQPQPPVSYTPPHLAERILAEQAAMESRGSTDGERDRR